MLYDRRWPQAICGRTVVHLWDLVTQAWTNMISSLFLTCSFQTWHLFSYMFFLSFVSFPLMTTYTDVHPVSLTLVLFDAPTLRHSSTDTCWELCVCWLKLSTLYASVRTRLVVYYHRHQHHRDSHAWDVTKSAASINDVQRKSDSFQCSSLVCDISKCDRRP